MAGATARVALTGFILALCAVARPAAAQSSTLFLEVLRDPGAATVPASARHLAMGGVTVAAGGAEDASSHPAGLLRGPGLEMIVSAGSFRLARDEFAATPPRLPPFDARRRSSPTSSTPVGYVAIATRADRWAAAAFLDASSRFAHAFSTDDTVLYFAALQGTSVLEEGAATASVSRSTLRLGGAFAAGNRAGTAAVGIGLAAVRLAFDARSTYTIRTTTTVGGGPPDPTTDCCTLDESSVAIDGWGLGLVLSAEVTPAPAVTIAGAWRHEPSLDGTRAWHTRYSGGVLNRAASAVTFALPSTMTAGLTVRPGASSTLSVEVGREFYAGTYTPAADADAQPFVCATIVTQCGGWNIFGHETADVTVVRAGAEQRIRTGRNTLALRAGLAHRPAHTLARRADDPAARPPGNLPHPRIVTDFEPPRVDAWHWSAGAAFEHDSGEVGVSLDFGQQTSRVLVDVRFRAR